MTFGPFGLLGSAAGIKTPLDREVGMGAALGGVTGSLLFDKNPNKVTPLPPQGQNDPRVMRSSVGSTGGSGYGRGSSSLSV